MTTSPPPYSGAPWQRPPGRQDADELTPLLASAAALPSRPRPDAVGVRSALAQAVRRPERQARLARLVRQPTTDVIDLGPVDATNVGRLLAASGTSDIVDAHVVICARRTGQQVVTSDPGDLRLLDPAVRLIAI